MLELNQDRYNLTLVNSDIDITLNHTKLDDLNIKPITLELKKNLNIIIRVHTLSGKTIYCSVD